jgi:PBP1b-binding outer membrane lipoprotein LpoB
MKLPPLTLLSALALTLMAFLFSACQTTEAPPAPSASTAVEMLAEQANKSIDDFQRAAAVNSLLSDLQVLIDEARADQVAHERRMNWFLADFDVPRETLEDELAQFNQNQADRRWKARLIADAIRAKTTADEWSELKKDIKNNMAALIVMAEQP